MMSRCAIMFRIVVQLLVKAVHMVSMKTNKNPTGYTGLLTCVIEMAVRDLFSGNEKLQRDAAMFFFSPLYKHYMECIGLPRDILPARVAELLGDGRRR